MTKPTGTVAIWIVVLGLVGFLAGSIMPFLLDANPGNMQPIVGLFVMGPIGIVSGLVLGPIVGQLKISTAARWIILVVLALGYFVVGTYLCVPYYTFATYLVDGEVIECKDAQSFIEPREEYWRKEVSRVIASSEGVDRWNVALYKERGDLLNWQQEVAACTRARSGTVLKVHIHRKAALYEAYWTSGKISRRLEWVEADATEVFFSDAPPTSCVDHQRPNRSIYQTRGESWERYPPRNLPAFLGLDVM